MLRSKQRETYLASREMHVGVAYGSDEVDFGGCVGISLGNHYGEQPETAVVWGGWISGPFQNCFPLEKVVVGDGPKVEHGVIGDGLVEFLDFAGEAFESGIWRGAGS